MKSIRYAVLAMMAVAAIGAAKPAFAGDRNKQDVVVATTMPNPVKADPAPKPNPVGQKISDYKPPVKIKPAQAPPSPKTKK